MKLCFFKQKDSDLYEAVRILNDTCGMIVGENIPAVCVIAYLQSKQ